MVSLCATPAAAILACLANGALFVGCLYIRAGPPAARRPLDRDDPLVIRQRFVRVAIASAAAPLVPLLAAAASPPRPHCPTLPAARAFGLSSRAPLAAALAPLALTLCLFLGPLLAVWLERDTATPLLQRARAGARTELARLQLARNLLVGPLAEEWVFRACMCPLLHGAGWGEGEAVLLAALTFGAAHVHHRIDGRQSWVAVAFQFTYTSLFGAYSAYLFLRTGLVLGPLLAHTFCNAMGVPDFGGITTHSHPACVAAGYVLGLAGFIALVTVDAIYRPALFGSPFWEEISY
ncbi:hypothetical protein AB1Y20_012470 [Prymnesium parvum]|uniref:intramembrane prenyl-peptidase Rce1 n=1 Tax=Prymnesium parvum TaxID=97485 RepID=A0AB34IJW9_PRYPA